MDPITSPTATMVDVLAPYLAEVGYELAEEIFSLLLQI